MYLCKLGENPPTGSHKRLKGWWPIKLGQLTNFLLCCNKTIIIWDSPVRKPVFGVSDKTGFKPVSSATEN